MPRATVAKALQETSFYGAVAFFLVLAAFPFYWMVITSFKTNADLYSVTNIPFWFNDPPTLEHFRYLFEKTLFTTWLLNSLIIGVCVTAITLVAALPAAYSLARMTGRNGEALGIGIFLTYLVPPTLLFLPLSRVVADLGLQNSRWSLVVVYPPAFPQSDFVLQSLAQWQFRPAELNGKPARVEVLLVIPDEDE